MASDASPFPLAPALAIFKQRQRRHRHQVRDVGDVGFLAASVFSVVVPPE